VAAVSLLLLLPAPYVAAGVGYAQARLRDERPPGWARWAGLATAVAHLAGLVLLSQATRRSPFQTESQALSFLAFSVAALYAVLERTSHVARYGGWFYLLAGLLASASVPGLAAEVLPSPESKTSDPLLSFHVGLALLGTAAIVTAGLFAGGYVGVYRRVKRAQLAVGPGGGPSLVGLQRLARDASFAGLALLAPALLMGYRVVARAGASGWAQVEIALATLQFLLLLGAWWLWWRRPLRGPVAAALNVAATLVAVASFAIVHPMLTRAAAL
jgi:ABC-type uncharacterized transport system permease subunit